MPTDLILPPPNFDGKVTTTHEPQNQDLIVNQILMYLRLVFGGKNVNHRLV